MQLQWYWLTFQPIFTKFSMSSTLFIWYHSSNLLSFILQNGKYLMDTRKAALLLASLVLTFLKSLHQLEWVQNFHWWLLTSRTSSQASHYHPQDLKFQDSSWTCLLPFDGSVSYVLKLLFTRMPSRQTSPTAIQILAHFSV